MSNDVKRYRVHPDYRCDSTPSPDQYDMVPYVDYLALQQQFAQAQGEIARYKQAEQVWKNWQPDLRQVKLAEAERDTLQARVRELELEQDKPTYDEMRQQGYQWLHDRGYLNLAAVLQGCVSGSVTEWPLVRRELVRLWDWILEECNLRAQFQSRAEQAETGEQQAEVKLAAAEARVSGAAQAAKLSVWEEICQLVEHTPVCRDTEALIYARACDEVKRLAAEPKEK